MRTRSANVDGLRVVALLAIVVGHVYTESELAGRLVQSWRLPLFFVLVGFFWRPGRPLRADLRGRWRTTAVPYLAWLTLITGVALLTSDGRGDRLAQALLGGAYAGRPLTTFWFLSCLLLAGLVYRSLDRSPALLRAAVCLGGLLLNVGAGEVLARVPLSAATALGAVAFIWCGDLTRRLVSGRPVRGRAGLGTALLVPPVVLLAVVGEFVPMDMKNGEFPPAAVGVALLAACGLVVLADALPELPTRLAVVSRAMARPAVVVVLVHPLVLSLLPPEDPPLPRGAIAALAFVVPMCLGLWLVQTRAAALLVGCPSASPTGASPAHVVAAVAPGLLSRTAGEGVDHGLASALVQGLRPGVALTAAELYQAVRDVSDHRTHEERP